MSNDPTLPHDAHKELFSYVSPDLKILIVEDSGLQAKALVKTFHELGFNHIKCCHKASLALESIHREGCDIVFCDWNMPEKSGLELLQEVRKEAQLNTLPFVLVTAHSEREKVIAAVKSGVTDYIVKPLTLETIEQKLVQLSKQHKIAPPQKSSEEQGNNT